MRMKILLNNRCEHSLNYFHLCPGREKVAKIEIEGLQALTAETVIATSGLKTGDTFSPDATDAAAQRLLNSGLFKRVAYRTQIRRRQRDDYVST